MNPLSSIQAAVESSGVIRRKDVLSWLQSSDLEVLGAAAYVLTCGDTYERIEPSITGEELEQFLFPIYERSLREDPNGEFALSRYEAARELIGWFTAVPMDEALEDQSFLLHLKDWMERVYKHGNQDVRDAITCGALEHILEEPRWRGFFADWRDDDELRDAYEHAIEWAEWKDSISGN